MLSFNSLLYLGLNWLFNFMVSHLSGQGWKIWSLLRVNLISFFKDWKFNFPFPRVWAREMIPNQDTRNVSSPCLQRRRAPLRKKHWPFIRWFHSYEHWVPTHSSADQEALVSCSYEIRFKHSVFKGAHLLTQWISRSVFSFWPLQSRFTISFIKSTR